MKSHRKPPHEGVDVPQKKTTIMAVKHNKIWFVRNWLTILRLLLISNLNTTVRTKHIRVKQEAYNNPCEKCEKYVPRHHALSQHLVSIHERSRGGELRWSHDVKVNTLSVSYTHLTLPTKRIV